jgi:hypothetical protein
MPNFRNQATGTISANGGVVALQGWREPVNGGVGVQLTGTFVGDLQVQLTLNGTTFAPLVVRASSTGSPVTTLTAPGIFAGDVIGALNVRVTATAWTSGTATVTLVGLPG